MPVLQTRGPTAPTEKNKLVLLRPWTVLPTNTSVAGIETIHGWAFARSGAPVSVFLRRNGSTDDAYPLPCCSPRGDVQRDVEGAPLYTGYSGVVNYAHLAHLAHLGASEHTVGVEIQADGHESVIIEHTIMVALPGNIEFNSTFSFEDAWTGVDRRNDQVLIINATTEAELGAANLRVDYSLPTQNTSIVEAYNESATTDADLDAVQEFLRRAASRAIRMRATRAMLLGVWI